MKLNLTPGDNFPEGANCRLNGLLDGGHRRDRPHPFLGRGWLDLWASSDERGCHERCRRKNDKGKRNLGQTGQHCALLGALKRDFFLPKPQQVSSTRQGDHEPLNLGTKWGLVARINGKPRRQRENGEAGRHGFRWPSNLGEST